MTKNIHFTFEGFVTAKMMDAVRAKVKDLFKDVKLGHGRDHLERVEKMALMFAGKKADKTIVSLIALLHDADDWKLFLHDTEDSLENACKILVDCNIPDTISNIVISEIRNFGYSNRLRGREPKTIEGKAVSDADMCDIMGVDGIMRLMAYDIGKGIPFFDPNDVPNPDVQYDSYKVSHTDTSVRHMFDKILRLPQLMLTDEGRIEANRRKSFNIIFLQELFREHNAEDWDTYLYLFLEGNMSPENVFDKQKKRGEIDDK